MSMAIPTKHSIWSRIRAVAGRFIGTQRAQIALWERLYAWPVNDGQMHWVDTVNGPVLRGNYLPTEQKVIR